jgi:CRISPR-associated protein Cas5 subtype I-C
MENRLEFKVWGRYALFTDPITRIGGEKCSYHIPTYEALKGIAKSVYWKPTFTWIIDKVRITKRIRTESRKKKSHFTPYQFTRTLRTWSIKSRLTSSGICFVKTCRTIE